GEASGVDPRHRPVLPPRGTTGTRYSLHRRQQSATCWVLVGRTTGWALPLYTPRQSVSQGSISEASVMTLSLPRARTSFARNSGFILILPVENRAARSATKASTQLYPA